VASATEAVGGGRKAGGPFRWRGGTARRAPFGGGLWCHGGWRCEFIIADNVPPQAQDDSFTVAEGAVLSKPIAVLLVNDSDSDGDSLQVSRLDGSSAKGGTVIRKDEEFVYTPPSGYTGADSFGYTVSDGNGGTDVATVHVTVESAAGDKQASGDAVAGGGGGGGALTPLALMFLAAAGLLFRGRSPMV